MHSESRTPSSAVIKNTRLLERFRSVATPTEAKVFLSSYYRCPAETRVPMVTTVHDFVYEEVLSGPKVWVHSHQKIHAIRKAADIICVSEATRDKLYRYVGRPEGRVHVIHNGVSEHYVPLEGSEGHEGFLLYVGNRHAYKNFELLLNALPNFPELNLVCVGGEQWTKAERNSVEVALKGELRIERGVPNSRLNELYNAAVCLVYPSLHEGFGIPVVEAMRAGCPAVAANCAAVKEAGGPALLVAENDKAGELAEQIQRCLSSERAIIVQAGLLQASKFSWSKTHAATVEILESYL